MVKTVYQTSRSRFFWGLGISLLLHILVFLLIHLSGIQRTSVPEYAGIVFIELADFDYQPIEPIPEDIVDPPAEPSPELLPEAEPDPPPVPQTVPEPAPPSEPAPQQPASPPVQHTPPPSQPPPVQEEEQLEFQFQQPVPDATLVRPDTQTDPAPSAPAPTVSVPDGPTESEIAFRRQNLEEFQSWLDSQEDMSSPASTDATSPEIRTSALSEERLREIDRVLSQIAGPQQQVSSINISDDDRSDSGVQDGFVPTLGGDRTRISGSDPVLGSTVLRSTDPPVLTAMVSFIVDADGRVVGLQFEKSSGNNEIDARIRSAVQSWRFTPVPDARNARGEITYTIRRVQ
ncbi:energy transducer TonB [Spirochaeta dissipatitropha]